MAYTRIKQLGDKAAELSNRIFNGETTGFEDTIKTLLESYRLQKQIAHAEEFDEPLWDECIADANQAWDIYFSHIRKAELAAAEEMRQQGLTNFAEAIESQEYQDLAY